MINRSNFCEYSSWKHRDIIDLKQDFHKECTLISTTVSCNQLN